MRIEREYHFYAGHRNQTLGGKCANIHGHRYGVTVVIRPERTRAGITMEFADIDRTVKPILAYYDHALMIDRNDPLHAVLDENFDLHWGETPPDYTGSPMKVVVFDEETSAENLARKLFTSFHRALLPVVEVRLRETDSSVVVYDIDDYRGDMD